MRTTDAPDTFLESDANPAIFTMLCGRMPSMRDERPVAALTTLPDSHRRHQTAMFPPRR
tara:strand:+ start:36543 stop:36719 length:177 start_codon:yes stop_codon:yes gene_type:complete